SSRGQFLSQDPVFLGNPRAQNLLDPQSLNAYSYSDDNPISNRDPNGLSLQSLLATYAGYYSANYYYAHQPEIGTQLNAYASGHPAFDFATNHYMVAGPLIGLSTAGALEGGEAAAIAYDAATFEGVGSGYALRTQSR